MVAAVSSMLGDSPSAAASPVTPAISVSWTSAGNTVAMEAPVRLPHLVCPQPGLVLSHHPGPQPLLAWSYRLSIHSIRSSRPQDPCYRPRWTPVPRSHSQILSHQVCPHAAVPRASRAPNASSRCVQATALTTAPAPSTRATSPSADVYPASWVTVVNTVSIHPNSREGRGEPEPKGASREDGSRMQMNQAQVVGAAHQVGTPFWYRE